MTTVSAQVSVYPLRVERLGPVVTAAVDAMQHPGLIVQLGPMSTMVVGELDEVFTALRESFAAVTRTGEAVMVVTLSNGCPVPSES